MTDIYLQFIWKHYGLYGNAPVVLSIIGVPGLRMAGGVKVESPDAAYMMRDRLLDCCFDPASLTRGLYIFITPAKLGDR